MKEALKAKGWTVQRLADEIGVSKRTLDAYMSGARKLSLAEAWKVIAISDALDVDPHELIKE